MLLAAAEVLSKKKNRIRGSLRFIFQPSEEKDGGASRMITDGCLEGIEEIYGAHLWNYKAYGQIGVSAGPILAATDSLRIAVRGVAGHGGMPQGTVDAIVVASALVCALQTVVSRSIDPMQNAVVTVGKIAGGDNHNVIASLVEMEGTVRTFSEEIRKIVKERILSIAHGIGKSYGAEIEAELAKGYPATVNDEKMVEKLMSAAKEVVGESAGSIYPGMGGEDFAYYAQKIPGCFFFVGSSPPGFEPGEVPHHCPHFDIDERALLVGASVFVQLAGNLLID
jgi:amidohydrolase